MALPVRIRPRLFGLAPNAPQMPAQGQGRAVANVRPGGRPLARRDGWVPVITLPGAAIQQVRDMGSQVFSNFGAVNLDGVSVRASFFEGEDSLAGLIRSIAVNADQVDEMTFQFRSAMQDGVIECKAVLWRSRQTPDTFVVVSDFKGTYVYQFANMPALAFDHNRNQIAGPRPARPAIR